MSQRLGYLPALDGLRAIAVTSVLLYHLDVGWAKGGFLGVDLFFVISGFLITTLLLRERDETGRIGLGSFWTRRFKRLVPPLVVMIVVTIVAMRLWGLPQQWASVRWDGAAALAYVANWRFVFADQSYFESLLGPSPLLHTWSLAVEEQWYLLWPLVMVALTALAARRRRGNALALAIVVGAAVASAVWMSMLYVAADPSRAYFGTDTRAQQLLIGAALAWLVQVRPELTRVAEQTRGAVAILAAVAVYLVVAAVTPDDAAWLYHGGFLTVSALCALLVLGTATANVARPLRWLTWAPLLWIGVRSYGIYLWHWPVIIFVGEPMGIDLPRVPLMILQVAVTLVLADLSHRLVERPVRRSRTRPSAVLWAWSGAAVLAVGVCFVVLAPPDRPEIAGMTGLGPLTVPTTEPAVTPESSVPTPVEATVTTPPPVPPRLLLLGDSTATVLTTNRTADSAGPWELYGYAELGCGIFDGATIDSDSSRPNPPRPECALWRTEFQRTVDLSQPDVAIIMVGAWEVLDRRIDDTDARFPGPEWTAEVRAEFSDAIDIAGSTGATVAVMSVPCMAPSGDENTTARTDPARVAAVNAIIDELVAVTPGATVFDLGALLCPDGVLLEDVDGELVRYDGVHLSNAGIAYVWKWLVPQLDAERARTAAMPG